MTVDRSPVSSDRERRVLIVGAGISGLLAARRLTAAGHQVTVLDKGRGVGGRMSTRRVGAARVDHGAQFFTAGDIEFREFVSHWLAEGIIGEWARGFAGPDGGTRTEGRPAYRGITGMSAVPKHVARGLDVRTGCRVSRVERGEGGYQLGLEDGTILRGHAVIMTAPVPQSLALIEAGGLRLPSSLEGRLRAVVYDPCFAVLAMLDGPSAVPEPGGLMLEEGPVRWIADNRQKGISPGADALTIHASAEYTRSRLDADRDEVARELLEASRAYLGGDVREVQVHRWLYSLPRGRPEAPFLVDGDEFPLVFAGDAFGGASVQGAALSGMASGDHLASGGGGAPLQKDSEKARPTEGVGS